MEKREGSDGKKGEDTIGLFSFTCSGPGLKGRQVKPYTTPWSSCCDTCGVVTLPGSREIQEDSCLQDFVTLATILRLSPTVIPRWTYKWPERGGTESDIEPSAFFFFLFTFLMCITSKIAGFPTALALIMKVCLSLTKESSRRLKADGWSGQNGNLAPLFISLIMNCFQDFVLCCR